MGPGQIFLTNVGSTINSLGLSLENFPEKSKKFQFFAIGVKKISSGLNKKHLGQRWVGLLFIAGKEYAWVGSGRVRAHLY